MKKAKQTNDERRAQAVQAILKSARKQFALCGFVGASISVIAKNADVNPSLIYHYFENKEELWKAVKRTAIGADLRYDFTAENENEDLYTFIKRVLTQRFEFYRDNPELLKIINWEQLQEGDSRLYGLDKNFKWPWNAQIKRFIKNGEARADLDAELCAILMISALRSIFTDIPNLYGPRVASIKQQQYLEFTVESVYRAFKVSD